MSRNELKNFSDEQIRSMAARARMVRDGFMSARDCKGRALPLRFWVAMKMIEEGVVTK